jgi:hypothetical protein
MIHHAVKISEASQSAMKESRALHIEKRRCARVKIGVPISCVSVDSQGRRLDKNKGIVKNVSQAGLRIEAKNNVSSVWLRLAFVDLNKSIAQISGRVVSSQKTSSATYKIGIQLQGSKSDIVQFVSKLVRLHHYTKKKCIG